MKKAILIFGLCILLVYQSYSQSYTAKPISEKYISLKKEMCKGWNTWNTNSMLSHVLMPEAFAINLCLKSTVGWSAQYLNTSFLAEWKPERIKPGTHADDGSYTSLEITYHGVILKIETAHVGEDIVILVSPQKTENSALQLIIESGVLWNRSGCKTKDNDVLKADLPSRKLEVRTTCKTIEDNLIVSNSPYLVTRIGNEKIGIFTGSEKTLSEIEKIISFSRINEEKKAAQYGDLSECYKAMQTVLAWNVIYEPEYNRIVSPVSRAWNYNWGGYVLFDWDTYFAAYMYSLYNKNLAYANAIEITKSITNGGFIPNVAGSYQWKSEDRSQPPVGSFVVREIYRKYPEKWFLEEVYDELLTWNRWWIKSRVNKGYLCWGSNLTKFSDRKTKDDQNTMKSAKWESGLDNSPMYDDIPFNIATGLMELTDVGLMSMYVMDCNALADIATILGKTEDAKELKKRSVEFGDKLQTLWSEKDGIFLNRRTDNNEFSHRISPTNFYPMLAKVATQKQAERMMKEHYFNPNEFHGEYVLPSIAKNDSAFHDNDYWRGRIWAPLNLLVYMGMLEYKVDDARLDLVQKSRNLLMKSWLNGNRIFENYNSITGEGDDVKNADWFYHWGALLGYISFIETGYIEKPNNANSNKK